MERAGRDEQNVIRAHKAVASVDSGSFDDGQYVALHALAADVGTMAALASGDLVDLVQEDNSVPLDAFDGDPRHLIHVNEFVFLFLDQILKSLTHPHFALARSLAEKVWDDILQ